MLIGLRESRFDVGSIDRGQYFLSMTAIYRSLYLKLEIVGIYGPADHTLSREFLGGNLRQDCPFRIPDHHGRGF
jgi:hypothetical protein